MVVWIIALEAHVDFLLSLIAKQSDLTLDEIVAVLAKRRIRCSRSAVWRFYARHDITFKKNSVCGGAKARGRGARAPALHRYFQPRGLSHLCLFPSHHRLGSPVPYKSLVELRAAYMPDAAWAVSVHPPS
jgi:hypothetical protein